MQPAIKVENLSKQYQLGLTHAGSVRELVNGAVSRVLGRSKATGAAVAPDLEESGHVWALKDVNFEILPGEAIGIIGRNGAGKSTLLKILSRITRPTTGRVEILGRVASLLEVGTGFHPELTGRENVYMNGTILGMTRKEITRQFGSIVEFAGVEKFIDTPVKRYSSGMTVRLGFAVAAHMSPEILIVDEVLAVGDAEFQKRCMGKMDDVAKSGRTVLFVSHNMVSIRQLTSRCALISGGELEYMGETERALDYYVGHATKLLSARTPIVDLKRATWAGDQSVRVVAASLVNTPSLAADPIELWITCKAEIASRFRVGATLHAADGTAVAAGYSSDIEIPVNRPDKRINLSIENPRLAPGRYWFTIGILRGGRELVDAIEDVLHFEIADTSILDPSMGEWNRRLGSVQLSIRTSCT